MPPLIADKSFLSSGLNLSTNIEDYPGGIIIPLDKPYRWTSADAIRKLKFAACRHFGNKKLKVGHAGTLDPLATGVLLVCIGKATRLAETLQRSDKEYIAGITFGATTPSYDLEKEIDSFYPYDKVTEENLRKVLPSFLGEQEQIAPLFSAKSVDGQRAYEIARKMYVRSLKEGGSFDHSAEDTLSKQAITIHEAELLFFSPEGLSRRRPRSDEDKTFRINVTDNSSLHLPHAEIRIVCSKGTYIRAFARDLGEALGSGAHLDSLERSRCGDFTVGEALTMSEALGILNEVKDHERIDVNVSS